MNCAASPDTAPFKPAQLVSEVTFGRYNETVAIHTWNTTTYMAQLAIADATGQHVSTAYLTDSGAAKLAEALQLCRYKRRALKAGKSVKNAEGERL